MTRLVAILLGSITGYCANAVYINICADSVIRVTGFHFAIFVPPLLISVTAGSVATILFGPRRFLRNWPVLLFATVLSYLTTIVVLWIGLQSMDMR